jgi:hypothetical protein
VLGSCICNLVRVRLLYRDGLQGSYFIDLSVVVDSLLDYWHYTVSYLTFNFGLYIL